MKQSITRVDVLKQIDSTNAYLIRQGSAEKIIICLSEYQSSGRGRRGRNWVSPFAKNIYLSFMLTVEAGLGSLEGLSLAVGVAIVRALEKIGVKDAKLKWPNDVLWRERKLAGVLIEAVGDPSGCCKLVVGIGLNLFSDDSMQAGIDQPWVSVKEITGVSPARNDVAAELINQIVPVLINYEHEGFAYYKTEWEGLNAQANKFVDLHIGSAKESGYVRGVSEVGALLLQTHEGEKVFHGGEISLRTVK